MLYIGIKELVNVKLFCYSINNTEILEAGPETPTLDTKSEEDPKLYQDAEGGHAKIDTDEMSDNSKKNMASIAGKGGSSEK